MAGTSMATPITAGSLALIRQYYVEGYHVKGARNMSNGINPSAALLKATVIASSVSVEGSIQYFHRAHNNTCQQHHGGSCPPLPHEGTCPLSDVFCPSPTAADSLASRELWMAGGYGFVHLPSILWFASDKDGTTNSSSSSSSSSSPPHRRMSIVQDSDIFLGNQDSVVLTLDFSDRGRRRRSNNKTSSTNHDDSSPTSTTTTPSFRAAPLRVVLAWSDPPASPAASKALVNDLDLELICRRGAAADDDDDDDAAEPTTQMGNGAYQRRRGGLPSRDSRNNVEVVDSASAIGKGDVCTVTVKAASVNVGKQNFALVVLSSPFFTSKISVNRVQGSSQTSLSAAEITAIALGVLGAIGMLISLHRCWQARVEESRRAEIAMHEILPSMEGAFGIGSEEEEDVFSIEDLDGGHDEIAISD